MKVSEMTDEQFAQWLRDCADNLKVPDPDSPLLAMYGRDWNFQKLEVAFPVAAQMREVFLALADRFEGGVNELVATEAIRDIEAIADRHVNEEVYTIEDAFGDLQKIRSKAKDARHGREFA